MESFENIPLNKFNRGKTYKKTCNAKQDKQMRQKIQKRELQSQNSKFVEQETEGGFEVIDKQKKYNNEKEKKSKRAQKNNNDQNQEEVLSNHKQNEKRCIKSGFRR